MKDLDVEKSIVFEYKLGDLTTRVLQHNAILVVIFDKGAVSSLTTCSKIFTKKEKADRAGFKINQFKLSLDQLISREKTKEFPIYKFHENQKRYQDKRLIEKIISFYKAFYYKGSQPHIITKLKKSRPLELQIPVSYRPSDKGETKATVYWVRESKLLSELWLDRIGYDKASTLILKTKNILKKTPEALLNTPNRNYILEYTSQKPLL